MNKQRNPQRHKPRRFESDAERIVHRHLANKDDVITEEDIRNIRIGLAPTPGEAEPAKDTNNNAPQVYKEAT